MKGKLLNLIPLIVLSTIEISTILSFVLANEPIDGKILYTSISTVILYVILLVRFKIGLFATGLLIVLSVFGILTFFKTVSTTSYFFRVGSFELMTPYVDLRAFGILLLFVVCNINHIKSSVSKLRLRLKR
jgi:hypothetical protein